MRAEYWPWGPPYAVVQVPKRFGGLSDLTFCVIRHIEDTKGRTYWETDGDESWDILTREEAQEQFGRLMDPERVRRLLLDVDAALTAPPRRG